jgi:hypothetical protein
MSESKMIGYVDAKRRQEKRQKAYKRSKNPWQEFTKHPDGSESGVEGYVRTIVPDDGREPFEVRGKVFWWRSAYAIEKSNF